MPDETAWKGEGRGTRGRVTGNGLFNLGRAIPRHGVVCLIEIRSNLRLILDSLEINKFSS